MTINVLARTCLILFLATALCTVMGASVAATYQGGINAQKMHYDGSGYQGMYAPEQSSAASMTADLLLVRPLSLAATVAGTGLFIVSLPFSILGNNVDAAAQNLIVEPAQYTFTRPLGQFPTDTNIGLQ